jgi:hypothetical protein
MRKIVAGRVAFLVYLLVVVIIGLEIALRLFFFDPNYYWKHRYFFASQGAFVNIDENLWTYQPDRKVRSVAVYGFPVSSFLPAARYRIEYDCTHTTNNLGLVQERDVRPGEHATLVLGDSFTEGQGGCPWFDKLAKRVDGALLINGGLLGAGPVQWRELVSYLLEKGVQIDRMLVIAISNDFKRGEFNWSQSELDCVNLWKCDSANSVQPLRPDESAQSILERSRQMAKSRHDTFDWKIAHDLMMRWSYAYTFLFGVISQAFLHVTDQDHDTLHPAATEAFSWLLRLGKPLKVVLVPQRDEVGMRQKNHDTILVEQFLNRNSVSFDWCMLSGKHFLPLDGHPNAAGYDVLSRCVEAHLRSNS